MADFWNQMKTEDNFTETENGAIALKSTGSELLDAFGTLGAVRDYSEEQIIDIFKSAYYKEPELSIKLLFYIRDIRGGLGERRTFRILLRWLAQTDGELVANNLDNILFYGRGDDLLCLFDTPVENNMLGYIDIKLGEDIATLLANEEVSLLAKWLPSINCSDKTKIAYAKRIARHLGMTDKVYRKTLSTLRKYIDVTEVKMSAKQWEDIKYENVPGKAFLKYTRAFEKHDEDRLNDFILNSDKFNSGALFPVDIVHKIINNYDLSRVDVKILDKAWKNLPNYCENETGLCVVDVSGSMYGTPMEVAISLGLYCAERCKGPYKDKFITFSANPQLVDVAGIDTIVDRVRYATIVDWGLNTNLEKVFNLILNTAINNKCKQEDLPAKLYIISDMQFDDALSDRRLENPRLTFMGEMREKFKNAGYEMPAIVYWNVRSSLCGMFQETFEGENVAMISGYSASLFKVVIEGTQYEEEVVSGEVVVKQKLDPMVVMLTALNNERYARVVCSL